MSNHQLQQEGLEDNHEELEQQQSTQQVLPSLSKEEEQSYNGWSLLSRLVGWTNNNNNNSNSTENTIKKNNNNRKDRSYRTLKEAWMVLLLMVQFVAVYIVLTTRKGILMMPSSGRNIQVSQLEMKNDYRISSADPISNSSSINSSSNSFPVSLSVEQGSPVPAMNEIMFVDHDEAEEDEEEDTYNYPGAINLSFTCPPNLFYYTPIVNANNLSNNPGYNESVERRTLSTERTKRNITMIVALKGQTGNYLSFVARAYGIKRSIERKYKMDAIERQKQQQQNKNGTGNNYETEQELAIQLVGEHLPGRYWMRIVRELRMCFPTMFATMNFEGGIWDKTGSYNHSTARQNEWMNVMINRQRKIQTGGRRYQQQKDVMMVAGGKMTTRESLDLDRDSCNETIQSGTYCWEESYCHLQAMLQQQRDGLNKRSPLLQAPQQLQPNHLQDEQTQQQLKHVREMFDIQNYYIDLQLGSSNIQNTSRTSLPYLKSKTLRYHVAVDEYYDEIRQLYSFNENECCGDAANDNKTKSSIILDGDSIDDDHMRPYDDEIVIHIRKYRQNLINLGFHELDPKQVATLLFEQYTTNPRDMNRSIAIVSPGNSSEYKYELNKRGFLNVRQVRGKTAMEDFCFLLRTKYHLIGLKMSTFAAWAGLLSNATKVRFYAVNSTYTRSVSKIVDGLFHHYQWKNPELRNRINYETYEV